VDVVLSKEHSGGTKAAVMLLTLCVLGPLMTIGYACIGTRSRALKKTTLLCLTLFLLSGMIMLAMAIAVPTLRETVHWSTSTPENTNSTPVSTEKK